MDRYRVGTGKWESGIPTEILPNMEVEAGGYLYLPSLKTLPDGVSLSTGGDIYLRRLTTIPEGVTLSAGGNLYMRSLKTLPKGVTLSAGRDLYLYSLKTLPEGVILSAGGGLCLSSLKTLPKGVTLSAGGNLYMRSLTTIPAGVNLSAGGYWLHGADSSQTLPDLKPWRKEMADCIAAFEAANSQTGDWCYFLHHEMPLEKLTEPWRNRIEYVSTNKPEEQRAARFRAMRPVAKDADIPTLVRQWVNQKGGK